MKRDDLEAIRVVIKMNIKYKMERKTKDRWID